jgi:hypothetical protein
VLEGDRDIYREREVLDQRPELLERVCSRVLEREIEKWTEKERQIETESERES